MVDGTPIRDFKNLESRGIDFPKNQPMRIYSSLWNADDWATRGGAVKTDWSNAPFVASYRNFNADACVPATGASNCASNAASNNGGWWNQEVDSTAQARMKWVQKNYMIYNYCSDLKRFPQGLPPECSIAWEKREDHRCDSFIHFKFFVAPEQILLFCLLSNEIWFLFETLFWMSDNKKHQIDQLTLFSFS